jgi:hypothetical protein
MTEESGLNHRTFELFILLKLNLELGLWFGNKYLDDFSSFFSSAAVGQ